ncbi:hypothetical protein [Glutamicibacter sp.]|uniref:hypothetical protein n=1 Tax=Glutamicibacter sp. TaxID=1931995 RepID=UPI0028BDDB4E|nr:hypothetical protein [Glutamicibacter sp.]
MNLFGKAKREVQQLRRALFTERLKKIELAAPENSNLGPAEWNISRWQSDLMGFANDGDFKNHYVVVEVQDLPTLEQKREISSEWVEPTRAQMFAAATGYWAAFLRSTESQSAQSSSHTERMFDTLDELHQLLNPLNIIWYPALQADSMLDGVGFFSPDWRCGAEPLPPTTVIPGAELQAPYR